MRFRRSRREKQILPMHKALTGYKWEGLASFAAFTLAAFILHFHSSSPIFFALFVLIGFLGACFGLSFMRTWKKTNRNVALAILLVLAVLFYLGMLLPI